MESKFTLRLGQRLLPMLIGLAFLLPQLGLAQYQGFVFLPQGSDELAGGPTWHSNLKMGSAQIINSSGNLVNVHSLKGPNLSGFKELYFMETTQDAGFIQGQRIWNSLDLEPTAICEVDGQGYAITAYNVNGGNIDGYLIAIDYSGNVLWAKRLIGGNQWEYARSVMHWAQGPAGAPEIVVLSQKGAQRTIISRYETTGPLISRAEIQIPGLLTAGRYLAPTSDGGYIFAANSYYQIHLFKYDKNNILQFSTTHTATCFTGFSDINTLHIIQTADEGYLLTGNYRPYSNTCGYPSPIDFWGYIAKFDDSGVMQWNQALQFPGAAITHFEAGAELPNQTYLAVGVSDSRPFYATFDAGGNPILASFHRSISGIEDGVMTGATTNPAFNGFTSWGHSATFTASGILRFLTIVNMDPIGDTQCMDKQSFDHYQPHWNLFQYTPNSTPINLQQNFFLLSDPYTPDPTECGFMKTRPALEDELESVQLTIYPQPATDVLLLELTEGSIERVVLTAMDGRTIAAQQYNAAASRQSIDLAAIPAGVYFLRVQGAAKTWTRKVVVQ